MFQVISDTDFSLAEIIEGLAGSLVPLLSVERTATPQIESTVVAYNIANIDERIDAVLDLTNNFVGNFSTIAAAIAYLNAYPFEERSRLRIVSRRASDNISIAGLTAPVSISVDGYLGQISVSSDCAVSSDTFAGRAEPHVTTLVVNTERFVANNLILSSVNIDLAGISGGSYVFENCEFLEGASISVAGSFGLGSLVFKNCSSRGGTFALQCSTTDGSIKISGCSFSATPATSSSAHGGSISITAASCSVEDTSLVGVGFTWGGSGTEFGLAVSNLEITDVSVTSARSGFTCASGHAMINDLRVRRSYRQSGSIVDLGQTVTSRIAGLLIDTCEVQFTVGVASLLRGGGESVLDGAVVSELSMPAPASTDPHIAIPNVFGFLYDGPEIISIVADNISESVGVGSSSTSGADGITGSSAESSLQPGISGLSISASDLPLGSGYVLSGNTISGYLAGQSVLVPSVSGLADRGLLQSHVNQSGILAVSYRVQKRPDVSDPVDVGFIKIVDVSDDHPLTPSTGSFSTGYQLTYSGGELSWALGEPVTPVLSTTHRLYTSDYSGWIDVYISSAPTGSGTDLYRVLPSVRDAGKLLLGHYWWDGAAVLGTPVDKRYFGNVAGNSLADSARAPELLSTADTRGASIFSGGLTVTDSGIGLNAVRMYGPMTAYVDGRRFAVPLRVGTDSVNSGRGGYGGITMPGADNYIYVDSSGVLLIDALAWPTAVHAKVARVQVSGGAVTSIDDFRESSVFLTSGLSEEWRISATPSALGINSNAIGIQKTLNIANLGLTTLNLGSGTGASTVAINSAVATVSPRLDTNGGIGISSGNTLNIGNVSNITSAGGINIGTLNATGYITLGRDDYLTPAISLYSAGNAIVSKGGPVLIGSFAEGLDSSLIYQYTYSDDGGTEVIMQSPAPGSADDTKISNAISRGSTSASIAMTIPNGGSASSLAMEANYISLEGSTGGVSIVGDMSISGDILGNLDVQQDLFVGDDLIVSDNARIVGDLKLEPDPTNGVIWRYVSVPTVPAHYIAQVDFPGAETDLPSSPFDFKDEFGSFNSAAAGYIGIVDITRFLGEFPHIRQIEVSVEKLNVTGGENFRMALINEFGQKLGIATGGTVTVSITGASAAGWFSNGTYQTYIGYEDPMTVGTSYEATITYNVTDFTEGTGLGNLILTRDFVTSALYGSNPSKKVYLAWRAKDGAANNQWLINYIRLKVGNYNLNSALSITSF
jgi:hypothetical protein